MIILKNWITKTFTKFHHSVNFRFLIFWLEIAIIQQQPITSWAQRTPSNAISHIRSADIRSHVRKFAPIRSHVFIPHATHNAYKTTSARSNHSLQFSHRDLNIFVDSMLRFLVIALAVLGASAVPQDSSCGKASFAPNTRMPSLNSVWISPPVWAKWEVFTWHNFYFTHFLFLIVQLLLG